MAYSPQARGIQNKMRRRTYDPNTFSAPSQFGNLVAAKKEQMRLDRHNKERAEDVQLEKDKLLLDKDIAKQQAKSEQRGLGIQSMTTASQLLQSPNAGARWLGGLGMGYGAYNLLGGGTKGLAGGLTATAFSSPKVRGWLSEGTGWLGGKLSGSAGTGATKWLKGAGSWLGDVGGWLGGFF